MGQARRIRQVQHRLALITEQHALIGGGQKAAGPIGHAARGSATCRQHHVTRQVIRFRTQAIIDPRPHGGAAKGGHTGVHHELTGMVIKGLGVHGTNHANVIGVVPNMG